MTGNVMGNIFDIQHYSIHDGPGIRTIVFFKGCMLRCRWCSNPESQRPDQELSFQNNKCINGQCLLCQAVCPERAIFYDGQGHITINWKRCSQCMQCIDVCPSKALTMYGEWRTVDDVLQEVKKDAAFYHGKGGMTLSGGEALLQADFAEALLVASKSEGIHTAIETCGYAPWENMERVLAHCDYIMFDVKSLDDDKHREYTGVSNQLILNNLKRLAGAFSNKTIRIRTPVIPGFNDNDIAISEIAYFIKKYIPHAEYELLKYHTYGEGKYKGLGRAYLMGSVVLDEEKFEKLKYLAQSILKN